MRLIKISLIALLLQGIPEQTAVITLAFVIAGIPLKWNRVLLDVGLPFIASSSSFLALVIFEFSCMTLFMHIFGFTPETLFNDVTLRIVVGEPQVLLLFISAFLLNKLYLQQLLEP